MRVTSEGSFELPRDATEAIGLFTPEGERSWVPGWDPRYPDGDANEARGTVFTTEAHGHLTTWVILGIDRVGCTSAYARITPDLHAGTVAVHCEDIGPGRCRVDVGYDMTLAEGAEPTLLEAYRGEGYAAMLREWAQLIETST